jgi:hypothetical protein
MENILSGGEVNTDCFVVPTAPELLAMTEKKKERGSGGEYMKLRYVEAVSVHRS